MSTERSFGARDALTAFAVILAVLTWWTGALLGALYLVYCVFDWHPGLLLVALVALAAWLTLAVWWTER